MGKRIVIALGGNALGKNLPEQMLAVKETSKAIADLVEAGHTVAVAHGNGPQVGMIQNAFAAYCRQEPSADVMPLSMCVAMSQGYIGYDLQNALKEELLNRGLQQGVATVLTQVVVDGNDPAFQHPTKPIGAFMSKEEAEKMAREKGWHIAEDAGRGWRQVVASPKPLAVVELTTIRALAEDLRYDDLLDLYPSMGTWPHRMTEVGQMYFPTCFVMRQGKDAWALSLIGAERPQVKVWKLKNIEGQWETEWEDFYQSRNPELLENLFALGKAIGQKGVSVLH